MAETTEVPLEIEFLDPIEDVEVGHVYRFNVLQRNARGERYQVPIHTLEFGFSPIQWGRVVPTDDPGLGHIQVIQIVEPEDVFLAPHYSVGAQFKHQASRTLAPKRRTRMSTVALEIELGFAVGLEGKWKPFQPLSLPRPVDLSTAKLSDPTSQKLIVRDGKVFLRMEDVTEFPVEVAITLPNGETTALRIEGGLRAVPIDPDAAKITRMGAPAARAAAPEDPETAACRAELHELRGYVASFGGAGKRKPDDATIDGIRRRIGAKVAKVKERLVAYQGPAQEELLQLFRAATDLIPAYLRTVEPAPDASAAAATSDAPTGTGQPAG